MRPFFRFKVGRWPVYDVGHILREKPAINPALISGLKRLRYSAPGARRGWGDES